MPEAVFRVRWPDGSTDACYSPSLVVHDHLAPGAEYPVADFTSRVDAAMDEASERVRAKYGTACTSAAATAAGVRSRASSFSADGLVRVLSIEPPL